MNTIEYIHIYKQYHTPKSTEIHIINLDFRSFVYLFSYIEYQVFFVSPRKGKFHQEMAWINYTLSTQIEMRDKNRNKILFNL